MKIDPASARALQAVIERDLEAITRLDARLANFNPEGSSDDQRDAAAYQLHNIYNALENSFIQVSRTFENHITQPESWHRELLEKMFLDLSPIRPALVPDSCRALLRDLMSFRHVFRHAYDFEIDTAKLCALQQRWNERKRLVLEALNTFAHALHQASQS